MIDPVSPLADAFATPPSIEAALARDPVAPQPHSSLDSRHSSLPEADPSAVARFREALALHEDLTAALGALALWAGYLLGPCTLARYALPLFCLAPPMLAAAFAAEDRFRR